MTVRLDAVCFDAHEPAAVAGFWGELLGWETTTRGDVVDLVPTDDTGFRLRYRPVAEPKVMQNLMHLDLTSEPPRTQEATVARVLELGGQHIDVGQLPEEGHVVMADMEGNALCVIPAGNTFLADCGFVGALSSDGSRRVGYFWSEALGWPLVWDQDEETAIRSPRGGPKITWGGPPLEPRTGRLRVHYDLVPDAGGDVASEVARLLELGATRFEADREHEGTALADPDGTPFWVNEPR